MHAAARAPERRDRARALRRVPLRPTSRAIIEGGARPIWSGIFRDVAAALQGAHRGRDAVLAFLARVMELTGGTFGLELEDVVGDERYVVALFRGHGKRGGKTLDNPTCLRVRFENGKPREIHEFVWDLFDVDEFWA